MITVLVDTKEQKTGPELAKWETLQPFFVDKRDVFFIHKALPIGDMFGNNQLIENKWGKDLKSSLNSYHLEDQLKRMYKYRLEHPGVICHLMMGDTPDFIIDLDHYKRAVSLGQQYGVWVHHRMSLEGGIEAAIHLIKNPPPSIMLNLPVSNTKKSPFLIRVLSQIEGVSVEFAEFAIEENDKTLQNIIDYSSLHWYSKIKQYYKKEMGALLDKILEAIG